MTYTASTIKSAIRPDHQGVHPTFQVVGAEDIRCQHALSPNTEHLTPWPHIDRSFYPYYPAYKHEPTPVDSPHESLPAAKEFLPLPIHLGLCVCWHLFGKGQRVCVGQIGQAVGATGKETLQ